MELTIFKEIRDQLQMTQEQMARELDISFCTINRWENGHTKPSRLAQKALIDLCKKRRLTLSLLDCLVGFD